ncbi:MAG TPA: serine/threonine-protein kinase [Pyrinomonadaceae bacterium]|nr:serine/threonine-protein kinase [Pyrinomonadaceae bacterium]
MKRPVWDRIQEIYYSTLPMPKSERSAFIASACDEDPFLLREVTSLLKADDSSEGFLESSVFELGLKIISRDSAKKSATLTDSLTGMTIDHKYLVERMLGHGGMGKVYLARDLTLHNRPVVIKVLLDASVKDDYVVRKFRQEVEALSRIDHPGVVNVLGAGELPDGKPYIVMQYVNGVTLRSQIPVEGMDLERAALILKQIGAALEHVHEQKIFHRDLKPDNIMLQSLKGEEHVKVVDFGIAKVKDSVVAPSTVDKVPVGTVLYMSPEQLRGGERITAASDIYSMGVIAYEMLTGRRPFNPASAPQLLEMHREGIRVKPIDLRSNISSEAQAIILRALSFECRARYQSAAEFGDSLARALLNDGETARQLDGMKTLTSGIEGSSSSQLIETESSSSTRERQFRLGKLQLAVMGGFLVVLIAVFAVLWILKQTTGDPTQANTAGTTPSLSTRSLIYSLTVQRMRNRKTFQDAFQSTGQDIFDNGDKFQLNIFSPGSGYVYVFNEGTPERNASSFTIIYPIPGTNEGSASVGANQWARTNWNTFGGQPGTENLWIAWSTAPVPQLESGKVEAFNNQGRLTGQSLDTVKAFLNTKQEESKPRINRDKTTQQTSVRGVGDVVVKMIEIQHR